MNRELLTYQDPKSPVSEVFRTLRTNIQFMNTGNKLKTLLVTSAFPAEGKSWITSNLAVTFAQAGKKVILVDADMRKGRQFNIFDVAPKPGLSNYLSNMDGNDMETTDAKAEDYIQETSIDNLQILVAGNVPPNPSELLVSERMEKLLENLKEMCDLVIIDGTPCDLVSDSIILSRMVDSTIIVTAQKETKKDNLVRIVKNIQNVGGKVAGVVVNKIDISSKKYSQTYYYGSTSLKKVNAYENTFRKFKESIANFFKKVHNSISEKKAKKLSEKVEAQQTKMSKEVAENTQKIEQTELNEIEEIKIEEKQETEISEQLNFADIQPEAMPQENYGEEIKEANNKATDKASLIQKQVEDYVQSEKQKQERIR